MKKYLNYKKASLTCLQFKGMYEHLTRYYAELILQDKVPIALPQELTLLTVHTDNNKYSPLLTMLNTNKIPFINAGENFSGEWNKSTKVLLIAEALMQIKTEHVLILDADNTVITPELSSILAKFKQVNKDILFAATANRFPSETIDVVPNRDSLGKFCWLSSGMAIGKTAALVEFYAQAKELAIKDSSRREQSICRELFNNTQDRVGFDYATDIFYTASWACIDEKEYEIVFD